jgi:IS605 OrfB family transposase
MNNIFIDTYFKNGAIYEARSIIEHTKNSKIIFGGKKLFIQRCQNKISKEEFELAKLHPLQVVGAAYNKGNCKFQIIDTSTILFKPCRNEHFMLKLESIGKNYIKYLKDLVIAQSNCNIAITYKLGLEYVYISFDLNKLNKPKETNCIDNRIFAIDLNPNYIGYSVIDWKDSDNFNMVNSGVISNKPLTDYDKSVIRSSDSPEHNYITNKRNYEITKIAHDLVKLAKHYQCQIFAIEDLNIESKDNKKGNKYNRLVNNQWNRNLLVNIITKDCLQNSIYLQSVAPNFTSFVGNLAYRDLQLPDMVLASIEISRRAYEFYHQYIIKDKPKTKNIIFNNSKTIKNSIEKSLEEFGFTESWDSIKDLYYKLKKMRCNYRFPLEKSLVIKENSQSLFSKNYTKQMLIYYRFT